MIHKKVPLKSKFGYLVVVVIVLAGMLGYSFLGTGTGRRGKAEVTERGAGSSAMQNILPKPLDMTDPADPDLANAVEPYRQTRRGGETQAAPDRDRLAPVEPAPLHATAGPRVATVSASEHPDERLKALPPRPVKTAPHKTRDTAEPPRWTNTLAAPATPQYAPDPEILPIMRVDPRRKQSCRPPGEN